MGMFAFRRAREKEALAKKEKERTYGISVMTLAYSHHGRLLSSGLDALRELAAAAAACCNRTMPIEKFGITAAPTEAFSAKSANSFN